MKLHVMLEESKYEKKQTTMFLLYLAAVAVTVNRRRKRPSFSILLRINFSLRRFGVEAGGKELNKYSFKNFFFLLCHQFCPFWDNYPMVFPILLFRDCCLAIFTVLNQINI